MILFTVLNMLGVPFIDKPVRCETIAGAMLEAVEDSTVCKVQRYTQMELLAKAGNKRKVL